MRLRFELEGEGSGGGGGLGGDGKVEVLHPLVGPPLVRDGRDNGNLGLVAAG